jgi:hypothetical protein
MTTVKSAVVARELASVRLATAELKDVEETPGVAQLEARAASPTFAVEFAVTLLLALSTSVIVTMTE